jgi:hypothetical protein
MTRGTLALVLLLAAGSGGCGWRSEATVVHVIKTGDYEVEFDGQQKRATLAAGHFLIVRDSGDIGVFEGNLWVGNRNYGTVRPKDKISVVGGTISVNGQKRSPSGS